MDKNSAKIVEITGEINELAKSTLDKYYKFTKSNSELCETVINRSQKYVQKIQNATEDKAMKYHRNAVDDLKDLSKEVNSAQERRLKIRERFLDAARRNEARINRLTGKFNDKLVRDVFEQVSRLELEAIKSRRCNQGSCEDTDLTRQIKLLIQNLKKAEAKVRAELGQAFENSDSKMKDTKKKLDDEFYPISNIMSQADSTSFIIKTIIKEHLHSPDIINLIKTNVENLIKKCQEYIASHKF